MTTPEAIVGRLILEYEIKIDRLVGENSMLVEEVRILQERLDLEKKLKHSTQAE